MYKLTRLCNMQPVNCCTNGKKCTLALWINKHHSTALCQDTIMLLGVTEILEWLCIQIFNEHVPKCKITHVKDTFRTLPRSRASNVATYTGQQNYQQMLIYLFCTASHICIALDHSFSKLKWKQNKIPQATAKLISCSGKKKLAPN